MVNLASLRQAIVLRNFSQLNFFFGVPLSRKIRFRKHRSRNNGFLSELTVALFALTLAWPAISVAQRGAGGIGGGVAGGGGLSGRNGAASGVDTKDELKSFHQVLAVQANTQQTADFHAMVKKTEDADAEFQALTQRFAKAADPSVIGDGAKSLVQTIEAARSENSQFLQKLSERQKAGLREMIKRISKTDSELEQQCRKFETDAAAKRSTDEVAGSAQNLGRTLSTFHEQQLGLGEEMSIVSGAIAPEVSFRIPSARNSAIIQGQTISFTTSGVIAMGELQGNRRAFTFELTTDLSDLQQDVGDLLRAALNRSDSCGEQVSIQSATLIPAPPASSVLVDLHYERWACFGGRNPNEMAEGNGRVEIRLTPTFAGDGTLRMVPEVTRVDAEGLIGDLLRSGALRDSLRDKIADTVVAAINQGSSYTTILPPTALSNLNFRGVQFEGTGAGKLSISLAGDIKIPDDKIDSLAAELKAIETKGQTSAPASAAQSTPR